VAVCYEVYPIGDRRTTPAWRYGALSINEPLVMIDCSAYVLAECYCESGRADAWSDEKRSHAGNGAERSHGADDESRANGLEDKGRARGQGDEGRLRGADEEANLRGQNNCRVKVVYRHTHYP